jgi:hypothetical protein
MTASGGESFVFSPGPRRGAGFTLRPISASDPPLAARCRASHEPAGSGQVISRPRGMAPQRPRLNTETVPDLRHLKRRLERDFERLPEVDRDGAPNGRLDRLNADIA